MPKIKKNLRDKSGREIATHLAKAALAKKAENLVVLDVRGLASYTDYLVIMSGRSTRHTQGLADAVDEVLRSKRVSATSSEGFNEGLWILLDYNDVVVHIFYTEVREFYNLEGLWHDAPRLVLETGGQEG